MAVRQKYRFVQDLRRNACDFDDIFIVAVIRVLRRLRFWALQPDHDAFSLLDKCITHSLFYFVLVYFSGALVYLFLHPREVPPDIFVQKFAHFIVIYVGLYIMHNSRQFRREYTEVVQFVNERTKRLLERRDAVTHRPMRNTIYTTTVFILLLTCIAGFSPPSTYVYEAITNGRVYFTTYLPVGKTPFSLAAYLHTAAQVIMFYYVYSYCTMFILVIVEPFLRLSMCYRVIAFDVRALRTAEQFTEQAEYKKLRDLMQEFNEISRMIKLTNEINSMFFVVYIFSMFVVIGLFVAVSMTLDSGVYMVMYMLYPINLYLVASYLCSLGQNLLDSALDLDRAIYECNWCDAHPMFKRLVLMFMLRCKRPCIIQGKSFYKMDFNLFAKITNNIYTMALLVRKFF